MGHLAVSGNIFGCHNLGGTLLRPGVLLISYNSQDSPHYKELSGSKYMWMVLLQETLLYALSCVNWQWICFSLLWEATNCWVYCPNTLGWSTWLGPHSLYTHAEHNCVQGAQVKVKQGWPGSDAHWPAGTTQLERTSFPSFHGFPTVTEEEARLFTASRTKFIFSLHKVSR